MPNAAAPSKVMKNADKASSLRWKGRSGRPMGSTMAEAGKNSPVTPITAMNNAPRAPQGKTRRMSRPCERRISSADKPSANQYTTPAQAKSRT